MVASASGGAPPDRTETEMAAGSRRPPSITSSLNKLTEKESLQLHKRAKPSSATQLFVTDAMAEDFPAGEGGKPSYVSLEQQEEYQ
ncbi:unnamed protein product [Linum trigynum]|uniref:Uncharacterized protein n=1 Tax=Linum trigynum TaxID=586398 RepID=A0AAV2GR10_9ROSI